MTTIQEAKSRLITKVKQLAYLYSPDEHFILASGKKSPHFFDMKPVMMDPESAHLLGVLIHDEVQKFSRIDAVGGLELGAVPLTGIAIAKTPKGSNLKGFIVRKEPKGRGGRKTGNPPGIEGSSLKKGDKVLLLEDVTTTGGSALKAAARLQNMGCMCVKKTCFFMTCNISHLFNIAKNYKYYFSILHDGTCNCQ